jgi:hypothetical protein
MDEPVTFAMHTERNPKGDVAWFEIKEASGRAVSHWGTQAHADSALALYTAENAGGRAPRGRCLLGHPCDRDRVMCAMADLTPENRAAIVLCDGHAAGAECRVRLDGAIRRVEVRMPGESLWRPV